MLKMFLLSHTEYHNIFQIKNHKLTQESFQNFIHQPHESTRCISQTKRHNQPFLQTIFCVESSLPFITISNYDLMIATLQINLGKILFFTQTIHYVIYPRLRKPIFHYDLASSYGVITHSPFSILGRCLYNKYNT